jgi:hypothetical protein
MEVPDPDTFRSLSLRSELQSSGVSLTDCPHNGRKNVADQMIMGMFSTQLPAGMNVAHSGHVGVRHGPSSTCDANSNIG